MGDTITTLSQCLLSKRLWHEHLRIEQCEKYHFHWRNLRILLDEQQYTSLESAITESSCERKPGQSNDQDVLLREKRLDEGEEMLACIEVISTVAGPRIHFHYGELRLELEIKEFYQLTSLLQSARDAYEQYSSKSEGQASDKRGVRM